MASEKDRAGAARPSRVLKARRKLAGAIFPARLLLRYALTRSGAPSRQPKLFFIGFNKTGTKTLHRFFRDNGYLSAHHVTHWARRLGTPSLARQMKTNHEAGRPLLAGLAHYDVYSDLIHVTGAEVIEANGYFRELQAQHPDAYFVFNDRPVEKWLRSRLSHEGGPRGSLVARYAAAMGVSEAEAPELWRAEYQRHKAAVEAHFAGDPHFMVFDIETGSAAELAAFLAPAFRLDPALWSHHGSRERRHGGAAPAEKPQAP